MEVGKANRPGILSLEAALPALAGTDPGVTPQVFKCHSGPLPLAMDTACRLKGLGGVEGVAHCGVEHGSVRENCVT